LPDILARRTDVRRFVSDSFDAADPQQAARLFDELEARHADTRSRLEDLVLDTQELAGCIDERFQLAYVDMTSDTTNEEFERAFLALVENVLPLVEERGFRLKRMVLESPAVGELDDTYRIYLRDIRADVELFREENIPLLVEDQKLGQEYEKIAGGQEAEFRGERYTTTQIEKYFDAPDRETREGAWRARADAFLHDAEALDDLYDRMLEVRREIAQNAGFSNYRDYIFKKKKRFDYTPEDCLAYHRAVEKHVVPNVAKIWEERRVQLGLESLRPWDVNVRPNDPVVDPEGRDPITPFESLEDLSNGCARIFSEVDGELGDFYREMQDLRLLDLENRPGKAPGAYMTSFADRRAPFILMNAIGTKSDVDTLLHEAGHAFHYCLARHQPLVSYHHTGHEFSEVASMGMELLARPYLGEFYNADDLRKILNDQIKSAVSFFPWNAMIDAFQHWVYTADENGREARKTKWADLERRYRPWTEWSGLEVYRDIVWQYPHVFDSPFYYIEYGIAQLAAFRVWLNSLEDKARAVKSYKSALSLGGSRPLPELFKAAGAKFSLSEETISEIMGGVMAQVSS
jgi:oligoendopeptidase F